MLDLFWYILAGGAIGFVVGLTGVGGGSFMTPILLAFGFAPAVAIGTDLLYAAITKAGGVIAHARHTTIDWRIVRLLGTGSIPSSLLILLVLHHLQTQNVDIAKILTSTLGIMLIATSLTLLFRSFLLKERVVLAGESSRLGQFEHRHAAVITVVMGIVLGVVVTLSSVGAGAFGAAILLILYPRMPMINIIGTDLAHAVPLTAVAGLGHMQMGHVDFTLLLSLITGSLPAIWLGTKLANRIPDNILRPVMAIVLLLIGIKYLF